MLFREVYRLIFLAAIIQLSLQPNIKCKLCQVGILKEVNVIPRNKWEFVEFTKNLTCQCDCSNGEEQTYLHYVPSSTANKTYIMCEYKRLVFGYCLEFNEGGGKMQPSIERCTEHSPCNSTYWSTDNYLNFQCFEKFGGLLTPMKQAEQLQALNRQLQALHRQLQAQKNENGELELSVIVVSILLCLSILGNVIVSVCCWRNRKTKYSYPVTLKSLSDKPSNVDTTSEESSNSLLQNKPKMNDVEATSKDIPVSEDPSLNTCDLDKTFYGKKNKIPIREKDIQASFHKLNALQKAF